MKKVGLIFVFGLFFFTVPFEGNAQVEVTVKPTCSKVIVTRRAPVRVGYVWVEGSWKYNRARKKYVWNNGYWVRAKRNYVYVAGYWSKARGGWRWVPGYWRRA